MTRSLSSSQNSQDRAVAFQFTEFLVAVGKQDQIDARARGLIHNAQPVPRKLYARKSLRHHTDRRRDQQPSNIESVDNFRDPVGFLVFIASKGDTGRLEVPQRNALDPQHVAPRRARLRPRLHSGIDSLCFSRSANDPSNSSDVYSARKRGVPPKSGTCRLPQRWPAGRANVPVYNSTGERSDNKSRGAAHSSAPDRSRAHGRLALPALGFCQQDVVDVQQALRGLDDVDGPATAEGRDHS